MVILSMSEFCLLQIARQKIRPNVQRMSHDPCPACGGTGLVKNLETMGLDVLRSLKATLDRPDVAVIEVRVSPDVAAFLRGKEDIPQLELRHSKRIHINVARDLPNNRGEFICYNLHGEKVVDLVK
jgi:ribonuclease E